MIAVVSSPKYPTSAFLHQLMPGNLLHRQLHANNARRQDRTSYWRRRLLILGNRWRRLLIVDRRVRRRLPRPVQCGDVYCYLRFLIRRNTALFV
jgi:hypothetical protein